MFVVVAPERFSAPPGRAAIVVAGALLASAWMLGAAPHRRRLDVSDEFSRGTFYYDSFGARPVMGWLVTGRIFDNHRVPVVSVLVLIGLGVCVWRFRRTETARAVPAVGLLSLLLFFGRPTLGFVIDVLPGATDLFLRRYVTGVHLAGIYLAGIGGAWAGTQAMRVVRTRAEWIKPAFAAGALGVVLIAVVAPAAAERYSYERTGAGWISQQRAAQSTDGPIFGVARGKAEGDRSRSDLRRHARQQGSTQDPVRSGVRRSIC